MTRIGIGRFVSLAALAVPSVATTAEAQVKPRSRPLYVIAHRINDTAWIDEALKSGANALEIDLRYKAATKEWFVDHDAILPTSVKLADWLDAAAKAERKYGKQWAALYLDIKTPEAQDDLRKLIRAKLPANLSLIFGCADYGKRDTLLPAFKNGSRFDGFSIDNSDGDPTPQQANDFYSKNAIANGWYGTGLFVGGIGSKIDSSLIEAVKRRDQKKEFKKVYTWTVEKESTMDYYFRELKVDGILVNLKFGSLGQDRIPTAVAVAKKYGVLATRDTPAFEVHPGKYQDYMLSIKTGTEGGAGTDAGIYVTLHGKSGDSPEYYLNDLIKGNAFENGQTDVCVLKNVDDVGELQGVTVRSDGKFAGAPWLLDSVNVLVGGQLTGFFSCRDWLQTGQLSKKLSRSAPAKNYTLSIKTGDEAGAGTDSGVFVTLHGKAGNGREIQLNGLIKGNAFERNSTGTCVLQNMDDVGELQAITVRSDGKLAGAAWLLDFIDVTPDGGKAVRFTAKSWFQPGQLSKKISR